MTVPVSSVPAVYAYLLTAVQTQLATDDNADAILLSLAAAGTANDQEPEIISIGSVRRSVDPETFIGSGGRFWLDEKYNVDCAVSVWTGSTDTDGAYTIQLQQVQRAWQLLSYFETAVRLDPSLGELVNAAWPQNTSQDEPEWTESPVGLLVEITFQIHVENLN